jgi:hypothetical protein
MDRCELAWAAGFFDGEGWANAVGQTGRTTRQPHARVNQADADGVPVALLRFRAAVGDLGRIGGPHREKNRVDLYRWEVSSRKDVTRLHELLAPWLGQVKLGQFGQAMAQPTLRSLDPEKNDAWRAWAAGFFDGEGSVYLLDHRSHKGYRIVEMAISQGSEAGTPEVLRRFARITGAGHNNGPYRHKSANLEVHRFKVVVQEDVEDVLTTLWPWLGPVKRAQASAVLDVIRSQTKLPRGRPDWGSHKTHCMHGHEYATNRLRTYVARGVGIQRRENKQCLRCAREQARARRGEKERPAVDDDCRSLSEHERSYLLK